MGVRILHDSEQNAAVLYCSTMEVAFGPVFHDGGAPDYIDAEERAEAFIRWLATTPTFTIHDARSLLDAELLNAYSEWLAQEADQVKREAAAVQARFDAEMADD